MTEDEYKNILDNENSHWWYRILDDLVEYYVSIYKCNGTINILDAGCGTGRIVSKLSKYGNAFGIDASPTAVEMCRSRGLTDVQIADLNEWKPEKSFNVIVSLDVLYHKSFSNVDNIIKSFHTALNSNGILVLNLPAFNILKRQHDTVVGGNKRFRIKEIKKMLIKNDFTIHTKTYRLPLLFNLILLRKLFFSDTGNIKSDLSPIYPPLNKILYLIHRFENEIIKMGFSIPFGSSLFVVAKKNSVDQHPAYLPKAYLKSNLQRKIKMYLSSRLIFDQLFKYSLVGILNTLIGLSVIYFLFNVLKFNYIVSNIIGYGFGLVNSFIWNKKWTFKSSRSYSKEIIPFLIVFGISYLANLITVVLSVETFKVYPNSAQIIGIFAYSTTNFLINKFWTFSKSKHQL